VTALPLACVPATFHAVLQRASTWIRRARQSAEDRQPTEGAAGESEDEKRRPAGGFAASERISGERVTKMTLADELAGPLATSVNLQRLAGDAG